MTTQSPPEAVAITGLACQFPGSPDAGAFWANLLAGRDCVTVRTREELAALGVPLDRLAQPGFVGAGGVIEGIADFDASYFGITPRDAELMDPQHRLFLQCAVTALEDAGEVPQHRSGPIGVYAAAGFNSYLTHNLLPHADELRDRADVQWLTGSDKDYLATHVSYRLGLTGPSMSVQSACSSGLVAVHLAAESLLTGECDVALAGAVSVGVGQGLGYIHTEGGILSADGRCCPFDAEATGTVFGSGVAVVVLKRLADALADADTVRAVLLGSAVNNDGSRKVGFTAPSTEGQVRVITSAHALAEVRPGQVSYVEAHGTGTVLGDAVELTALNRVFGPAPATGRVLGAVKSNVGHLDTCAGMAGLIKTVLCLQHRTLVPTAHYRAPHPDLDPQRFRILTRAEPWPAAQGPRVAGVSSFGIGGTNAHVVLREPPAPPPGGGDASWHVLPLSARSAVALDRLAVRVSAALGEAGAPTIPDAAHTLQTARQVHPQRRALLMARDREGADGATVRRHRPAIPAAPGSALVFLFPGQGGGDPGIAAQLYREEPVFATNLDKCLAALRPWTGESVRTLLLSPGHPSEFERTEIAQPALFAQEYAICAWLGALGVRPSALIGHSAGEIAAVCAAGLYPLEQACRLIALRGQIMSRLPAGVMLAVPLPEQEVLRLLDLHAARPGAAGPDLAAVNAPDRSVVSGTPETVASFGAYLADAGVASRPLPAPYPFHSRHLDPLLAELAELTGPLAAATPSVPVISTSTGHRLAGSDPVPAGHWAQQARAAVRFADALAAIPADATVIEVGPGRALGDFARRTLGRECVTLQTIADQRAGSDRAPGWLVTVAALWQSGHEIDWASLGRRDGRRRVPLPTYPFEPVRHWFMPARANPARPLQAPGDEPAATAIGPGLQVLEWSPVAPQPPAPVPGSVVVLCDAAGIGEAVSVRLRADGCQVRELRAADWWQDPAGPQPREVGGQPDPGWLDRLAAALAQPGDPPDAVVNCWPVDEPPIVGASAEDLVQGARRVAAVPVYVARAVGDAFPGHPIRMLLVTDCAHSVGGQRPRAPQTAAALGPARVIPLEMPAFEVRNVDLDCRLREPADLAWAAGAVLAELRTSDRVAVAARRGRSRLVQVPAAPALVPGGSGAPEPGTYLITGGLGGIGLALAGHLSRGAGYSVVLLSRRPVPDGPDWATIRPTGMAAAASSQPVLARALGALAANGTKLCLVQADVTDGAQLAAALQRVRARYGRIAGVVHAAGIPGGKTLATLNAEDIGRVLEPKVRGALLLRQITGPDRPDFAVLCSSALAAVGAPGQADYVAANAVLDSLASTDDATISIGWDRWAETGMAVRGHLPEADEGDGPFDHPLFDARRTTPEGGTDLRLRWGTHTRWLAGEHRLAGQPVLAGTALAELAVAGYQLAGGAGPVELTASFIRVLPVTLADPPEVWLRLRPTPDGRLTWRIVSSAAPWQVHAEGSAGAHRAGPGPAGPAVTVPGPHGRGQGADQAAMQPAHAADSGTGPRWKCITAAHHSEHEAVLALRLPAEFAGDLDAHPMHPALIDAAIRHVAAFFGAHSHVPVACDRMVSYERLPMELEALVARRDRGSAASGGTTLVLDLAFTGSSGTPVACIDGLVLRPGPPAPGGAATAAPRHDGLATADALAAFGQVLANMHLPHVLVGSGTGTGTGTGAGWPVPASREASPAAAAGRHGGVESLVAQIWRQQLGVEEISPDETVFALGADSLLVMQIAAELQRAGLAVSAADVFSHPTISELAAYLATDPHPAPADVPGAAGQSPGPGEAAGPRDGQDRTVRFPQAELSADEVASVLALLEPGGNDDVPG